MTVSYNRILRVLIQETRHFYFVTHQEYTQYCFIKNNTQILSTFNLRKERKEIGLGFFLKIRNDKRSLSTEKIAPFFIK